MITQSDPMVLEPAASTFPAKNADGGWKIGQVKFQFASTQRNPPVPSKTETMAAQIIRNLIVRQTRPILRFHKEATPRMKWHGSVTEINNEGFWATFQSCEADKKAIVAEFDLEEIAEDDRQLLRVGAPLVWAIFTEREKGGLKNSSTLYVRRIAAPSSVSVLKAKKKLDEWFADAEITSPED